MYNKFSSDPNEFINQGHIEECLVWAQKKAKDKEYVYSLVEKSLEYNGLTHEEACVLTYVTDKDVLDKIYAAAHQIKEHIYGKRIVMFAPLYLSNYCVNECEYCGYKHSCDIKRKKLTQDELRQEVIELERMGHKRLALETGEDPVNCPIDYVIECIKTIYSIKKDNGEIRRVNVNVAATTVENYKKLKDAGIGTYILFQETYHRQRYEQLHKKGPKHNWEYHTTAMDRAMQAGIDDVGCGVLYGLCDWHFDLTAQLMHAEHLEAAFGVGPHTISVPRLKEAPGVDTKAYPNIVTDEEFKHLVAILRLAVPYTGMIISTRESAEFREEIIKLGISQTSSGSNTGVGGYSMQDEEQKPQFEVSDTRSPIEVTKSLLRQGYIPSFCTACYRQGRTGDRFMRLAKTGQIANVCQANALITLKEYTIDYGDEEFKQIANELIAREIENIPNPKVKEKTIEYIEKIEQGDRDFRF